MAGEMNNQDCPPVMTKIDDPELLLVQIVECIDLRDARGLKTYILEHKLREESLYWDLVVKIGEKVTSQMCEEDQAFFDVCNRCMVYLVKMGKPKEMLLAVLEQMDTFIDDVKYKCFLPLLQISLFKISAKLFHSLDIALETVSAHIRGLQVPENVTLEGDERKLYHLDKDVVRIVDNVETFLDFLEPFVKSVSLSGGSLTEGKRNEALVLKKHLIRLFSFPLYRLDLTHDPEKAKTNSRLCAEKAMELLCHVETDFQRLIANADSKSDATELMKTQNSESEEGADDGGNKEEEAFDNEENEKKLQESDVQCNDGDGDCDFVENWDFQLEVTQDTRSCLAYILHVESIGMDKYPQMYSREFLFEFHLPLLSTMLKDTFYPVNYKGLLLCKALTDLVGNGKFESGQLDNPHFMILINDLIHIMIKCPVRDHRTIATSLFTAVIKKFVEGGRYQVYQNILSSCSHSGVKGYVVTILKNDVSSFISEGTVPKATTNQYLNVFSGPKLMRLVRLACFLPDKETSDMLENSDQIISALNFLRFIVAADPVPGNKTGFWDEVADVEKDFLVPLRRGLDMSQAHYKLELENVRSGKNMHGDDATGSNKFELSLSAGGVNVPTLEKEEKLNVIQRALNTHQLMISLLCRLTELMEQNSKAKLTP